MSIIKYRVTDIEKLREQLDPALVDKANQRALSRVTSKLRTFVSRQVRSYYNVTAGAVSKRVTTRLHRKGGLFEARLVYAGRRPGTINFGAKPKRITLSRKTKRGRPWGRFRTGVSVKTTKTSPRKTLKMRAFIATGKSGNRHVFLIKGRKMVAMTMPSVPEMVERAEKVSPSAMDYDAFARSEHAIEFDRNLQHLLSKRKGK